ncbi:type I polyketide synthase [Saccharothrix australiensis]|uniref:Acyl transferase domain-containing protein n=1 Tax=Saccharothrix australiensis TaxID=2072 RepID=A0A495W2G5_9PSEU|nr:type I polyketide synthase [Saccharothrix australiensis]RKT55217.1 acyl transferase domain-containing protein [Saccharothrix australiensis]
MSAARIAIVGMACRYPDADSPDRLWENVLAGRRAFRPRPGGGRDDDGRHPAGPVTGPGAADPAHRLALEVAGRALADAGFPDAGGLAGRTTRVVVAEGPDGAHPVTVGGTARGVAARIGDHFGFTGGGHAVDDAWSWSLLPVVTAAEALAAGEVDVALAGGVDVPAAVVADDATTGGAPSGDEAACGVVVLVRERDALDQGLRVYATITGWGVSSGEQDHPEVGHRVALRRAYRRAGYDVGTVSCFQGHGVDAALGDARVSAALSAVEENIGHTRAAAGVAGLLAAALAVFHQTIPPPTGPASAHFDPTRDDEARAWPADRPVRAGVAAAGKGGTATHVALELPTGARRAAGPARQAVTAVAGRQDAELLLVDGPDLDAVRGRLAGLADRAATLTDAGLTDLAGALADEVSGGPVRAAVVATSPDDARRGLARLVELTGSGGTGVFRPEEGVFFDRRTTRPAIAYLFPAQGSRGGGTGALWRRFPVAAGVLRAAGLPSRADRTAPEDAQLRVVAGSLAAVRVLATAGVAARIAVGHSLGEFTAFAWAGAMGEDRLLALVAARGRVMARASDGGGAMAVLVADPARATALAHGEDVVIAGYHGPDETVVSGPADAVDRVCAAAAAGGVRAIRLKVPHAFHSPLVQPAADAMGEVLAGCSFRPVRRAVVSTVTADLVDERADLRALLRDQVLAPVRFHEAARLAVRDADLVLEPGPGRVLTDLVRRIDPAVRALPVDTESPSLAPLLAAVGAAFALGAAIEPAALFARRVRRPLRLDGPAAGHGAEPVRTGGHCCSPTARPVPVRVPVGGDG